MGRRCAYGVCNSDSRYSDRPHMMGVRFFPFPKPTENLEKCKRWVYLCGRKNFTIKDIKPHTYICSKHFVESSGPSADYPEPISALKEGQMPLKRRRPVERREPPLPKKRERDGTAVASTSATVDDEPSTPVAFNELDADEGIETLHMETVAEAEVHKQSRSVLCQTLSTAYMAHLTKVIGPPPQVVSVFFSYKELQKSTQRFKFLTGLSVGHFNLLLDMLNRNSCEMLKYGADKLSPTKNKDRICRKLSIEDRLLIVLMRLRRAFTELELAIFFNVSQTTVSHTLLTWVQFMYLEFKRLETAMFHVQFHEKIPRCFRKFTNLRVILDCTEVLTERPQNFTRQGNTYSSYKHHNTTKFVVGINVYGGISFASAGFEGSMSDKEALQKSNIANFLKRGDAVMVDRGFNVEEFFNPLGVKVFSPPFLRGRQTFTAGEEIATKEVARARVHVERAIGRIKNYQILQNRLKLNISPITSQMFFICCFLVNFEKPFVS